MPVPLCPHPRPKEVSLAVHAPATVLSCTSVTIVRSPTDRLVYGTSSSASDVWGKIWQRDACTLWDLASTLQARFTAAKAAGRSPAASLVMELRD